MYETIDEIETETRSPELSRRRFWIICAVFVGIALLVGAAIFMGQDPDEDKIDKQAAAAEQAAYRAALVDVSPALRRARLTDFLNVYPESDRRLAAKAQLQVIAEAEARDWAVLSQIIFDTEEISEVKLEALSQYEDIWDVALLGGREAEVARIKESLAEAELPVPDRNLPIDPETIPTGVSGDAMAGGARPPQTGYIPARPPVFQPRNEARIDDIVPLRIRKNRSPKYPKRALERGAEAVVVLELFVDVRGRVEMTELVSIDADDYEREFIRAASRAARRTRFYPQMVNGVPVPTQAIEKIYRFEIGD